MGGFECVWDTTAMADAEQFAYWRDVVWDAFVPVTLSREDEGSFPSRVSARQIGPIGVSLISSQRQSVSRTEADIERREGGVFFVNMPLTEGTWAEQSGRRARLRAGDFTIVDSEQPFHLGFGEAFDQISLMIPHELVHPLLASPSGATAVRVRGDAGVGAVAAATIKTAAREATVMTRREARVLANHLASLIAFTLRGLGSTPAPADRRLLLDAALDELEDALHDPTLAPSTVAARLSISVRYLHKLFAERGTTFGRYLLARRLDACRRCLEDPGWDGRTVTDIAISHGFGDPAYFSRVFKGSYGLTPSEYRLGARGTSGDAGPACTDA